MKVDTNSRNLLIAKQLHNDLVNEFRSSIAKIKIPDNSHEIGQVGAVIAQQSQLISTLIRINQKMAQDTAELKNLSKDTKGILEIDKTTELKEELSKGSASQKDSKEWLSKLFAQLTNISALIKGFTLPNIFPVSGTVDISKVSNLPPLEINKLPEVNIANFPKQQSFPLSELQKMFSDTQTSLTAAIQSAKTVMPKSMAVDQIKTEVAIKEWKDLLEYQDEIIKGLNLLVNKEAAQLAFPSGSLPVEIQNWKIPQPVTNFNLNPLRGFVHTTDNTVGITAVALPQYGQLNSRRSLIIYNNSSNTIYIGGSDVTVANGLPIPANSYAPAIDAGYDLIVYGVAATPGNDVRCIEISYTKEDTQL